MYTSHNLAMKIKETAKIKNIVIKQMLVDCELGSNTMSALYHGKSIAFDSLAKIADYLDCSVDYLLGRDNRTKKGIDIVASKVKDLNVENYNEKTSVLVSDVEGWNIKNTQEQNNDIETITENEKELFNVYRSLSCRDRHKLMTIAYEMQDKASKI